MDDGKLAAKFSEDEQGVAKKITIHLVRLLNIPSVRERALSNLWTPSVELMCEIMSKDPSDANIKSGKRAIVLLSQISSAAQDKQDSVVIDLTEKAADQLVQIVARQCSESMWSIYFGYIRAVHVVTWPFDLYCISVSSSSIYWTFSAPFLVGYPVRGRRVLQPCQSVGDARLF